MGPHKASKSPPSVSWLRRKEQVRGLYALPLIPINGISALTKLFSAEKAQKIISNLLKKKPSGFKRIPDGYSPFIKIYPVFSFFSPVHTNGF